MIGHENKLLKALIGYTNLSISLKHSYVTWIALLRLVFVLSYTHTSQLFRMRESLQL